MNAGEDRTGAEPTALKPMGSDACWYAIRTRSNHEKIAASLLAARGFEQYLPLYRARKVWSDRAVKTSNPLFPGYVFCRFHPEQRTPILSTPGVVSVVAFAGKPAPIDNAEIEAIQTALGSGRTTEPYPYLNEGQRVRVQDGPLNGLEGILIKKRNWRIVISVETLQRSIAVEIDADSVAPFGRTLESCSRARSREQIQSNSLGACNWR